MGHNEPVEHAQKTTGVVTVGDFLAVLRRGNYAISIHGYATPDRASYSDSFVFDVAAIGRERITSGIESRTTIAVPGYVRNGNTSEREILPEAGIVGRPYTRYSKAFRPTKGHWYLSFQRDQILDILELLPKNAEVSLEVALDAGTNGYLIGADVTQPGAPSEKGLHSDHLYLEASYEVRGKRKTRRFLIDTTCGAHNSARFGVSS